MIYAWNVIHNLQILACDEKFSEIFLELIQVKSSKILVGISKRSMKMA
jgi:hypothetical protein